MSHDHAHPHTHAHASDGSQPLPEALDLTVPESELSPGQLGRRSFLRRAGLLGAAAAGTSALAGGVGAGVAAAATPVRSLAPGAKPINERYLWLAGDHHIHTQYSPDAQYRVSQQVNKASQFGLDWMVITDHGTEAHAKIGVEATHPDIVQSRVDNARTLVFQGLEWNIPAAEHGTVFVAPGDGDVALLKEFENTYDGSVTKTGASTPANEALARRGIAFLGASVTNKRVADALMLANHPARKGIDSPHEIRGWRDTDPTIAIGMEGAPGHQAAAIPGPGHENNGRGYYDNAPSAASFAAYPPESYLTYGGFDWMTSTVGGLWDSLLAEGKPWWITANSDSHQVYGDTFTQGTQNFNATGSHGPPVDAGSPILSYGDFWPGYYSNTVVGATDFSYGAVMAGMRAGRMYVTHGGLIGALSVTLSGALTPTGTLGSTLVSRSILDPTLQLDVTIALADRPNYHGDIPKLTKLDVIVGTITGAVSDADSFSTPNTKVEKTFEVGAPAADGTVRFTYKLGRHREPFYVRLRGSDGRRSAVGLNGAAIDPSGPKVDALGNADPWEDLWFYTNPIFWLPRP